MKITTDLVKHLATLSRLNFNEEETAKFQKDFADILGYIDQLNEINTDNVCVKNCLIDAETELRSDEIENSLPIDKVVLNSPKSIAGSIVVPTVVEEE